MPEIKRIFRAGKMNRSLDDRLVPNGEYREALNINVSRSDSSDTGAAENILGNVEVNNPNAIANGVCIGSYRDNGNERIYYFVTNNNSDIEDNPDSINEVPVDHGVFEYDQRTNTVNRLASGSWLNFHTNFTITGINFVDGLLFWTDDRNQPRKINVERARSNSAYYVSDKTAAVAKFAPFTPPTITNISTTGNTSTFLEDKLVRFAYRFKYDDGEFSTISPLTPIAFTSLSGTSASGGGIGGGEIPGFVNLAKQVFLSVTVPPGYGITAVEMLYNESTSSNIYILDDISVDPSLSNAVTIEYTYDSQDPFRTLPGNQLTRAYDAVPRKAKSQEFAGGRIIYGNFLQNYNLPSISFEVTAQDKAVDATDQFNRFSVKSRRTYQVGLVLADEFGRQSPVILSSTGGDTVYVEPQTGVDAMQQLHVNINTDLPTWAHSYRVVVKQRQQEYYNWFTDNSLSVNNNNLNKIPRDTTQEAFITPGGSIASTNIKVFPKIGGSTNSTTNDQLQVSQLTISNSGARNASINGYSPASGTNILETIPRESELDIFYETSTGGLVSSIPATGINVDFFNCWIYNFGSTGHVELNRLRAGFNEPFFTVGLKAFVVQDNFSEQRRFNTLIHSSGLFNSRVGINYVNQFNEAEGGITVSLDPADGSVQKLYAEDTQLIIFQEDKISRSPIDKDFIYSAEGGQVPVTSNTQYLGTIAPFAGEYGISTDPESFAVYGTRKYISDKNRGVVLRLSNNGLTEISASGMPDFFRDALRTSNRIIGSYDEFHDHYNITIVGDASYTGQRDTNIATAAEGYFTVSFEDELNGWASFKSFKQEGGTTLNNRYYTFNGGGLWQHDAGEIYNNFYGTQYTSYMECIMNEAPSNVKEFKTINYEGDSGWVCDTVKTEQDELRLDPTSRQLATTYTASLNITNTVINGIVSGTQTQEVIAGNTPRWIIKVSPADPTYRFTDPGDLTITFDGNAVTPILNTENNSIYYVAMPSVAPSGDIAYSLTVSGEAPQDVSGAILTINLVDSLDDTVIQAYIPTDPATGFASDFRAGPSSFAYVSGAENTDIEIGIGFIDQASSSTYELVDNGLRFQPSSAISSLITGSQANTVDTARQNIYYRRLVTLPGAATSGSVTVDLDGGDPVRIKPRAQFNAPTFSTLSAAPATQRSLLNWDGGTDTIPFPFPAITNQQDTTRYPSGTMVDWYDTADNQLYLIPSHTNGTTGFDFEYASPATLAGFATTGNDDINIPGSSFTRVTQSNYATTVPNSTNQPQLFKGAYKIEIESTGLTERSSRTDDSYQEIDWVIDVPAASMVAYGDMQLNVLNNGVDESTEFNDSQLTQTVTMSRAETQTLAFDQYIWGMDFYLTFNTAFVWQEGLTFVDNQSTPVTYNPATTASFTDYDGDKLVPAQGRTYTFTWADSATIPNGNYRLYMQPRGAATQAEHEDRFRSDYTQNDWYINITLTD